MSGYLHFYAQQKAISAVAEQLNCAGDSYHHTGNWGDEWDDGRSHIDNIQAALNEADSAIAALLAENARLKECGHTLCGLLQEIASSYDRYAGLDGNDPACRERVNGIISKFRSEFKEAK